MLWRMLLLLLCLFLSSALSVRILPASSSSSPSSASSSSSSSSSLPYYVAAAVEHFPVPQASSFPVSPENAKAIILKNLQTYETHIANAVAQGVQIIVFPEYGLFGSNFNTRDDILPFLETIPDPTQAYVNPCQNASAFANQLILLNISCLAKQYNLYIVVDMGDLQPCSSRTAANCPSDGRFQYNSLVAFSPSGQLVARYHKEHLYQEAYYDSGGLNPTYFDTDFGVRFGMLICFDLIFTDPSILYISTYNITDVVFATEWENLFPVLSATQIQQGWSRVRNANLIAAGFGMGKLSSGSGIYSQGEPLAVYFNPVKGQNGDKLIVSKVPKLAPNTAVAKQSPPKMHKEQFNIKDMMKKLRLWPHSHVFMATPGSSLSNFVGKSGGLTCTFSYSVSGNNTKTVEKYALITFESEGLASYLPSPFRYCGLLRCESDLELCGIVNQDMEAATVFDSFSISGTFESSFSVFPLVSSVNGQIVSASKVNVSEGVISSNGEFGQVVMDVGLISMLEF